MREPDRANPEQLKYERAHQLQAVGFDKLGNSPLFRRNNFLLSIDGDGNYQFFVDCFSHLDPSMIKGIRITSGESTVFKDRQNLLVVTQYPNGHVGMNESVLGGSGRSGPADNPSIVDEFTKPLNEQLTETGFTPVDEEVGVYHTVFDDEHHGKTDIYVVLEDGKVQRIINPVLKSYPEREKIRAFIRDLGATITGFEIRTRTVDDAFDFDKGGFEEKEEDYDVLIARSSTLELEYYASGDAQITRLLRDLEPAEVGVVPFEPVIEPTGFVVGGVNSSELLRTLSSLNGIPIEQLERAMRGRDISDIDFTHDPYSDMLKQARAGAKARGIDIPEDMPELNEEQRRQQEDSRKRSETSGNFLGRNKSLRDLLAEDNDYVLSLGLTHQDLARMIKYTTALTKVLGLGKFTHKGRTYSTSWEGSMGYQESPFADGTRCSSDFEITNEGTGAKFYASVLHGVMIERYGFYEGKDVGYRLEPKDVVEVFDFLKEEGEQRLTQNQG